MPIGKGKHPRGPNQLAKLIVDIVTGDADGNGTLELRTGGGGKCWSPLSRSAVLLPTRRRNRWAPIESYTRPESLSCKIVHIHSRVVHVEPPATHPESTDLATISPSAELTFDGVNQRVEVGRLYEIIVYLVV
jgi:hypothetical protein